jgi:hypothetical protein
MGRKANAWDGSPTHGTVADGRGTEIDPWDGRNGKAVRGTVPQRTANVQLTYSQRSQTEINL